MNSAESGSIGAALLLDRLVSLLAERVVDSLSPLSRRQANAGYPKPGTSGCSLLQDSRSQLTAFAAGTSTLIFSERIPAPKFFRRSKKVSETSKPRGTRSVPI